MDEYLIDLNAGQAAIRAGYSRNGARVRGHRLLRNKEVAAAVAERQAELRRKTQIRQEDVVEELSRIAFSRMSDFAAWRQDYLRFRDSSELTPEQMAAVAELSETPGSRRIRLHPKLDALEKLGRHLGLFNPGAKEAGDTVKVIILPEKSKSCEEWQARHELAKNSGVQDG